MARPLSPMSRSGSTPPAPPDPQREIRRLSAQIHTLTAEAQHNEAVLKHFHEREFTLLGTEKLPRLLEELTRGCAGRSPWRQSL